VCTTIYPKQTRVTHTFFEARNIKSPHPPGAEQQYTIMIIASSVEYIQEADWPELEQRMKAVKHKEVVVPLANSEAFDDRLRPCKKSHVRDDSRGNKQIAFSWNKKKRHVMIHVLSLVVATHKKFIPSKDTQVSHLCNNHWCHEPSHLCLESSQQNQSRKNCIGKVWSHKYQDWVQVCNHSPPCLTTRKGEKRRLFTSKWIIRKCTTL
jgi:hypothetical protein